MSRGNRRRPALWLARIHRYAGITAAVFTLLLAVTGVLLQHAPALGLDRSPTGSAALARWLGIEVAEVRGWPVGDRWLLEAGTGLWLDGERIAPARGRVTGVVATRFGFAVATGGGVRLFRDDGSPVERLRPGAGLPGPVERLGRDPEGRPVLAGAGDRWRPEPGWLGFERHDGDAVDWASAGEPPQEAAGRVRDAELARAVDWERLLLALHSGRIAGTPGAVVMDLAALALIVLAATGGYLWWRRR